MHTHQDVISAARVSHHERHVFNAIEQRFKGDRPELAVFRRDTAFADPPHELLGAPAIADEVGNANELQAV